jgi:Na+-transporting methylmalonyl-CoA/oxaloacetate decarboxylase gamma subunit
MTAQIVFILQGFGLVMVVLALLWFLSAMLGRLVKLFDRPASPPAPAVNPSVPVVQAGVPAAHVAAITAAVAVATGGRGRVVQVLAPAHGVAGWIGVGRTGHMLNKRVRWDWSTPQLNQPSSPGPGEDAR